MLQDIEIEKEQRRDTSLQKTQAGTSTECAERDFSRCMRLRLRIFSQQWTFYCARSCYGWDFGFRTYAIMSFGCPLAKIIERDDVVGLQELFSNGKGTPLTILQSDFCSVSYALLAVCCPVPHRPLQELTIVFSGLF